MLQHGARCWSSLVSRQLVRQLPRPCLTLRQAQGCNRPTLLRCAASNQLVDAQHDASQQHTAGLVVEPSSEAAASSSVSSGGGDHGEDAEQPEFPEMQLQLPPPANSQIKAAEFVKSSVAVQECPPPKHPEFAVIGRSNVGKSSLINMLTRRKSLAMVSKQPGKTRCINHFLINDSWYLVDLPGYGYARTGKEARKDFETFTRQYFKQRATLAMVLLLVDCSIPPQEVDLEYAAWLGQQGLPFSIVFTKADKRKKGQPKHGENVAAFKQALLEQQGFSLVPPCLVTSASTGMGKQELLNFIASLRVLFEQQRKQARHRSKQPARDEA